MRKGILGTALAFFLLPGLAFAQGAVLQQGSFFQGHAVMAISNGYIADGGGPLANGLSPVDPVTSLLPLGFASVNSGLGTCQFSAYGGVPHSFFCLGFDGNGNGLLNLGATNSAISFSVTINGVNYPFPGNLAANAILPTSPPIPNGDLIALNTGFLLKDGGPPLPTFAQGDIVSATAPSGPTALQARYADTGVNILDFNRTACSGSDDTAAFLAAVATGQAVNLPGGGVTCNLNTANYAAAIWPAVLGSGYVIGDTVTLANGLTGTVYSNGLSAVTRNSGGTGYAVNDIVTLVPTPLWAQKTITNAVWASSSGGTVTYTCASSCGVSPGQTFMIDSASPGGYNGSYLAITGTGGSTLVAAKPANPGTYMANSGLLDGSPEPDSNATVTVNTLGASNSIATFTITKAGMYSNQLPVTFTSTGGTGSGATWTTPIWGVGAVRPSMAVAATSKPSNPVGQSGSSGSGTGATFNVTYAVAALMAPGQIIRGSGEGSTIIASTASNAVLLELTANGQQIRNVEFNAPAMSDGWLIFDDGASYLTIKDVEFVSSPGLFAATNHSGQVVVDNIRVIGMNAGGTVSLLNPLSGSTKAEIFGFAPVSQRSNGLFLNNVIAGLAGSTSQFIEFDGYYNSSRFTHLGINNPGLACFRAQNSFDTGGVPNFVDSFDFQCQTPGSNGWSIASGVAHKFIDNFCNAAQNSCVAINGGVGGPNDIEFYNNQFQGAGNFIFSINTDGYVAINGGYITTSGQNGGTCSGYTSGLCPLIGISSVANNVVISGATLKRSAGYGVEALSGSMGVRLIGNLMTSNALGAWQNDGTQDCSGISIPEIGTCTAEATVSSTGNATVTAANLAPLINGGAVWIDRVGATSVDATDITGTATAILADLPGGGFVGQQWTVVYENETPNKVTLTGGAGVTVNTPQAETSGSYRKFLCTVTNTGTPAITCAGQANQNS